MALPGMKLNYIIKRDAHQMGLAKKNGEMRKRKDWNLRANEKKNFMSILNNISNPSIKGYLTTEILIVVVLSLHFLIKYFLNITCYSNIEMKLLSLQHY